jgi:DNA-binding response OmpR family regulator
MGLSISGQASYRWGTNEEPMKKKVLILDDDFRFAQLVNTVLSRNDREVVHAATVSEGTKYIERGDIDLAIVDYRLGVSDGISWITWLRDRGTKIPVVFLSGFHCDIRMLSRLRNILHVTEILSKPIDPLIFANIIECELQRSDSKLQEWLNVSKGSAAEVAYDQWDAELQTLKAEYATCVPEKLAAIRNQVKSSRLGNLSDLAEAGIAAHQLRGTAGSYGFSQLGDLMEGVENLLLTVQNNPSADRLWHAIYELLDLASELFMDELMLQSLDCGTNSDLEPFVPTEKVVCVHSEG